MAIWSSVLTNLTATDTELPCASQAESFLTALLATLLRSQRYLKATKKWENCNSATYVHPAWKVTQNMIRAIIRQDSESEYCLETKAFQHKLQIYKKDYSAILLKCSLVEYQVLSQISPKLYLRRQSYTPVPSSNLRLFALVQHTGVAEHVHSEGSKGKPRACSISTQLQLCWRAAHTLPHAHSHISSRTRLPQHKVTHSFSVSSLKLKPVHK